MGENSPKACPLLFNHPEAFDRLPNYGVYSILYTPLSKPKDKTRAWREDDQPVGHIQLLYTWKSSIPRNWRATCKRGIKSACRSSKDSTLQFLLETQKYIHSIRKPTIIDSKDPVPLPVLREERKTANKAKEVRKEDRKAGYSVKYFGDINGEIGVKTRKVTLERPMTTKPPLTTSLSLNTVSHLSPASPQAFSTPVSRHSPRMQVHLPYQVFESSTSLSPSQTAPSPVFTFERTRWRKQESGGKGI